MRKFTEQDRKQRARQKYCSIIGTALRRIGRMREMMKLGSVRVMNMMADRTICRDLENHGLPENVIRLISGFIREGAEQRENHNDTSGRRIGILNRMEAWKSAQMKGG